MHPIVLIADSAGGLDPLMEIVAAPKPCHAAVFVVQHIGTHRSVLPELLARAAKLPATRARDGEPIRKGQVYVAPPDHHMTLVEGRVTLDRGQKVKHPPAADPLFLSACAFGRKAKW